MNRLTIVWAFMAAWLAVSCATTDPNYSGSSVTFATWGGTITPTGAETVNISYVIRMQQADCSAGRWRSTCSDSGQILLPSSEDAGGERQVQMTDFKWDGTTLGYSWTDAQGTQLSCELVKQTDTLLSGDCLDPSGGTRAQMTVSPPAGRLDPS